VDLTRVLLILVLSAGAVWGQPGERVDESVAAQRRARDHQEAKRYVEAERAYREALELWSDNGRALNNLAWMLLTADDVTFRRPQEALSLAEQAVRLAPDDVEHLDTLATAYDALGRHLEAARGQGEG